MIAKSKGCASQFGLMEMGSKGEEDVICVVPREKGAHEGEVETAGVGIEDFVRGDGAAVEG